LCLRTARARAQPSQVVGWRRPGLAAVSHHTVRMAGWRQDAETHKGPDQGPCRGDAAGTRTGTHLPCGSTMVRGWSMRKVPALGSCSPLQSARLQQAVRYKVRWFIFLSELSSLLTVKTLSNRHDNGVYPRENCIAPAIVLIVWTTNTIPAEVREFA